jgi:acyl-CoA hydrolase
MEPKTVDATSVIMSHMMLPPDANSVGIVHGGVVMKHIDDAAGVVAVRHSGGPAVTASIDRLDFHHPAFIGNLLTVKAAINLTGETSMEIGARVETEDPVTGVVKHTASAYLTFVALDENNRPRKIPGITPVSAEEKRRHCEAIERRKDRLAKRTQKKSCR